MAPRAVQLPGPVATRDPACFYTGRDTQLAHHSKGARPVSWRHHHIPERPNNSNQQYVAFLGLFGIKTLPGFIIFFFVCLMKHLCYPCQGSGARSSTTPHVGVPLPGEDPSQPPAGTQRQAGCHSTVPCTAGLAGQAEEGWRVQQNVTMLGKASAEDIAVVQALNSWMKGWGADPCHPCATVKGGPCLTCYESESRANFTLTCQSTVLSISQETLKFQNDFSLQINSQLRVL